MGSFARRTKSFNFYFLAKLMWDVNADVDEIVQDYFNRCYVEAAGPMQEAYRYVEQAHPDLRYWKKNVAKDLQNHPVGEPYSAEVRDYARNAVWHLTKAQDRLQEARGLLKSQDVRSRMDRFEQSLDYTLIGWQALADTIEGTRHLAAARAVSDDSQRAKELDAAEKKLKSAQDLSRRRDQLAAENPGCGLYWDAIGGSPSSLVKTSRIKKWLDQTKAVHR